MSHKPNLLSWDQDVAASPREFHETDNNRTNSAALLATWQYFSFRHIWFSKLLSHQKLSQIILSYFSNALSFEHGKTTFQISGKLSSFARITNKKIARHFEKHRCVTWRHTGSDESTNVYPRDAPSLLVMRMQRELRPKSFGTFEKRAPDPDQLLKGCPADDSLSFG